MPYFRSNLEKKNYPSILYDPRGIRKTTSNDSTYSDVRFNELGNIISNNPRRGNIYAGSYLYKLSSGDSCEIPNMTGPLSIIIALTESSGVTAQYGSFGTPVTFQAHQAVFTTYGFNIVNVFYIDSKSIFLVYNWKTSDTALSKTFGIILSVNSSDSTIYKSGVRTLFDVSIVDYDAGVKGNVYQAQLFPIDFSDDRTIKALGVTYFQDMVTATGDVSKRTLWAGYYAIWSSTYASRIALQTVQSSGLTSLFACVPSAGSGMLKVRPWPAGGFTVYNPTTSTRIHYVSRQAASNVGALAAFQRMETEADNDSIVLGQLSDGNVVVLSATPSGNAISIRSIQITSTQANCVFTTIYGDPIYKSNIGFDNSELLKGDILLSAGYIYQIVYDPSHSTYSLEELGQVTNRNKAPEAGKIYSIHPKGIYSSMFYNWGEELTE